eukprot:GHRR01023477.1.p1 GENE.GHRR01023477.1~~GHRR01023477.1.p1  ORF type:complete len:141 (-),score=26.23 GHRR01023477.1:562-984(-)
MGTMHAAGHARCNACPGLTAYLHCCIASLLSIQLHYACSVPIGEEDYAGDDGADDEVPEDEEDQEADQDDDDVDEDIAKLDNDLDAQEEADKEDIQNVGFTLFEKVHRSKNRWRCNLRFGVFLINGKEYLFNKGTTDLMF